jgi:hypothetical protein
LLPFQFTSCCWLAPDIHTFHQRFNASAHIGLAIDGHQAGRALANGTKKAPGTIVVPAVTQDLNAVGMQGRGDGVPLAPFQLAAFKGKGNDRLFLKLQDRMFADSTQVIFPLVILWNMLFIRLLLAFFLPENE